MAVSDLGGCAGELWMSRCACWPLVQMWVSGASRWPSRDTCTVGRCCVRCSRTSEEVLWPSSRGVVPALSRNRAPRSPGLRSGRSLHASDGAANLQNIHIIFSTLCIERRSYASEVPACGSATGFFQHDALHCPPLRSHCGCTAGSWTDCSTPALQDAKNRPRLVSSIALHATYRSNNRRP